MATTDLASTPLLPHPHLLSLSAASGWLDLGNAPEAHLELESIPAEHAHHPLVLCIRWDIFAATKHWGEALEVARTFEQVSPEKPEAWIKHAFALHELGRTQEAWDTLQPLIELFPGEYIIPYNLACYACQLGRQSEAIEYLKGAARIGGKTRIKKMALKDADLQPMWGTLRREVF